MKIEWRYRTFTVGSHYLVEIQGKDGNWYVDETGCDGHNKTIVSQSHCSVSVNTLLSDPFNIVYNDLVMARVKLIDEGGW